MICHVNDFDAIRQNWQAVRLQQSEHHYVIGTLLYAYDSVGSPIEFFSHATPELGATLESHSEEDAREFPW